MLRKCAKVINGEYREWIVDEGPSQPIIKEEKTLEHQLEQIPIKMGRIMSINNLGSTESRGMRLA